jgi:hypothetical protein
MLPDIILVNGSVYNWRVNYKVIKNCCELCCCILYRWRDAQSRTTMLGIEEHELHTRCLIKCLYHYFINCMSLNTWKNLTNFPSYQPLTVVDNVLPLTQQQPQKNKEFTMTKSKQKWKKRKQTTLDWITIKQTETLELKYQLSNTPPWHFDDKFQSFVLMSRISL